MTTTHRQTQPKTSRLKVQFCSIKTRNMNIDNVLVYKPLLLFDNEKYALSTVFCKGEADFSHLSAEALLGGFLTRPL